MLAKLQEVQILQKVLIIIAKDKEVEQHLLKMTINVLKNLLDNKGALQFENMICLVKREY